MDRLFWKRQPDSIEVSADTTAVNKESSDSPHLQTLPYGKVQVTQPHGFFCKLHVAMKIDLPEEDVWELFTNPAYTAIFHTMPDVQLRRVLSDDGNRSEVEMETTNMWKWYFLQGTFQNHLIVTADRRAGTIDYRLAKGGFMKDFRGHAVLRPYTQDSARHTFSADPSSSSEPTEPHHPMLQPPPFLLAAMASIQRNLPGQRHSGATMAVLEQSLQPSFIPPPPVDRIFKIFASRQVQYLMEDLEREVRRRKEGGAKLPDLEDWQLKQLALGLGYKKRVLPLESPPEEHKKPGGRGEALFQSWKKWTRQPTSEAAAEAPVALLKGPEK